MTLLIRPINFLIRRKFSIVVLLIFSQKVCLFKLCKRNFNKSITNLYTNSRHGQQTDAFHNKPAYHQPGCVRHSVCDILRAIYCYRLYLAHLAIWRCLV